jgi:hypothetical protein
MIDRDNQLFPALQIQAEVAEALQTGGQASESLFVWPE